MPAKNSIKEFVPNAYYHIYNRGVEKRTIFQDEQDRAVFLSYLKTYLLPKDEHSLQAILAHKESSSKEKDRALKLLRLNNFADSLTLLAFCLMPNHFHFLVKQTDPMTIDRFMQSFCTRYTVYFNKKYRRVGGLFQGLYKAVRVTSEEQLLHLSRYIHRNPITLASQGSTLQEFVHSSYPQYVNRVHIEWIHPEDILSSFPKSGKAGYREFVEGPAQRDSLAFIAKLTLDEEA